MENKEDAKNKLQKEQTTFKSRRLKRKSQEGSATDGCYDGNLSQKHDRPTLSPKLRKYSHRTPTTDSAEQYTADVNSVQTDMKDNASLSSCELPEFKLKPSKGITTKSHRRSKDRKKPLVPRLDSLNEDRYYSECAAGFILSPRAEKPYKCNFCAKQFKYFSNLKSHMNIVHKKMIENSPEDSKTSSVGNGQIFECEICFRNFKYFSNLRTHRLVHTSEVEASNAE